MVRSKSQVLLTCPGANQMVRGCPQSPLASETCQAPEITFERRTSQHDSTTQKVVFGSPRCGKKYGSVMKHDGYIGSLIKSIHPAKQYQTIPTRHGGRFFSPACWSHSCCCSTNCKSSPTLPQRKKSWGLMHSRPGTARRSWRHRVSTARESTPASLAGRRGRGLGWTPWS